MLKASGLTRRDASIPGDLLVTVDNRLAPGHHDPDPVEDCYAVLLWTAEHARGLGVDPRPDRARTPASKR